MTDLSHFRLIKDVEDGAARLGMRVAPAKYFQQENYVALVPIGSYDDPDHTLPIWSRDAELCTGSYETLRTFLAGWEKHRMYMYSLKLVDDKKIAAKESLVKQDRLIGVLKNAKST